MLSRVVLLFLLLVAASFAQDCQLPLCTEFGVIIRDFVSFQTAAGNVPSGVTPHPDFFNSARFDSNGNFDPNAQPINEIVTNAVGQTLGVDAKPVFNLAGSSDPNSPVFSDASNFEQWFKTVQGVNTEITKQFRLTRASEDDLFTFNEQDFFPIDGEGFGNLGAAHNFGFTVEAHSSFTYDSTADQTFEIVGDDDIWVFVNDQLAGDLGGIHDAASAVVDLSTYGFQDGEQVSISIFFAERHPDHSSLRFSTGATLSNSMMSCCDAYCTNTTMPNMCDDYAIFFPTNGTGKVLQDNPCTINYCTCGPDPNENGCTYVNVENGTPCGTVDDPCRQPVCEDGFCVLGPRTCDICFECSTEEGCTGIPSGCDNLCFDDSCSAVCFRRDGTGNDYFCAVTPNSDSIQYCRERSFGPPGTVPVCRANIGINSISYQLVYVERGLFDSVIYRRAFPLDVAAGSTTVDATNAFLDCECIAQTECACVPTPGAGI